VHPVLLHHCLQEQNQYFSSKSLTSVESLTIKNQNENSMPDDNVKKVGGWVSIFHVRTVEIAWNARIFKIGFFQLNSYKFSRHYKLKNNERQK